MSQPNPFAQPAAVPTAPATAQPNPFGAGVQTAPATAPVPAYAPPATPAYVPPAAPAPQAYAPAAGVPSLDPNALNAAGAPPASYAKGPELPDMFNRLVLIFPQSIETVPRNPKYITDADRASGNVTQDRLTATFVILDSGPGTPPGGFVLWGGNPHALGGAPHTNNDPLPYVVKGKWISQTQLIAQCRGFLPATPGGAPGMVAGRLSKQGPAHNDPWYLIGATPAEMDLARTYIGLVGNGVYPHPLAP